MKLDTRRRAPTMADIKQLQEISATLPQVECPTVDHFSEGAYVREFHMAAGNYVVGKEHRHRHLNMLVKGKCTFWTVHGVHTISAQNGPVTFESMAGVKKIVYAHTDIIWMTIHPTDETDPDRLEFEMIRPEEQSLLFPELEKDFFGGNLACLGEWLQLQELP